MTRCEGGCDRTLVGRPEFRAMSPAERIGKARRETRTLCGKCYERDRRAGQPRKGRPHERSREVVLEDVEHLMDSGERSLRRIAHRLDMKWATLNTAIWRACRDEDERALAIRERLVP